MFKQAGLVICLTGCLVFSCPRVELAAQEEPSSGAAKPEDLAKRLLEDYDIPGIWQGIQQNSARKSTEEVGEMLAHGRLLLVSGMPHAATVEFMTAVASCDKESPNYARSWFHVGEGYFQLFMADRRTKFAEAAVKAFQTVIEIGGTGDPDYVGMARMRLLGLKQALGALESGTSAESGNAFRVKTVPRGTIEGRSYRIVVGDKELNGPFWQALFVNDTSEGTPDAARRAAYLSDAAASEVARRLGIEVGEKDSRGESDDLGVANIARAYRKSGYADVVLRNGERFGGQWGIIEYDLNMPAIPVSVFERFGSKVEVDWSGRKVVIKGDAETSGPTRTELTPDGGKPKDWFVSLEVPRLPVGGEGGTWIIGFRDFELPERIAPDQEVRGKASLLVKDSARESAGAAVYISLFGDWSPSTELARLYEGTVGEPRVLPLSFSFRAPPKPGTYRLRCPVVLAFAPVKSFLGSEPAGQQDPGVGLYVEISFQVAGEASVPAATQTRSQPAGQTPSQAARQFVEAGTAGRLEEALEVVSDDVWMPEDNAGTLGLGHGKKPLADYLAAAKPKEPVRIKSVTEDSPVEGGSVCRVRVAFEVGDKERNIRLWFRKVDDRWLLFTPSPAQDGYSQADVDAAFQAYVREFTRRGPTTYSNHSLKQVVPNLMVSDCLYLIVELDWQGHDSNTGAVTRSGHGTERANMARESGGWKYAGW